ncbi:MAG: GAF domain-containing protein [Cyanobacteriota bacterium]|jgi:hypothetical protein
MSKSSLNPQLKSSWNQRIKYWFQYAASQSFGSVVSNSFIACLLFIFFAGSQIYSTLSSSKYWEETFGTLVRAIGVFLRSIFSSWDYIVATIFLLALVLFGCVGLLHLASRKNKVKYDPKEHCNFYVSQILCQKGRIQTKSEFDAFRSDFMEDLFNLFRYKSIKNRTSWLKPTGNRLVLYSQNSTRSYTPEGHFSFKKGEGVAGKCWETGEVQFYSNSQPHENYKTRDACVDLAYLCCSIPNDQADSRIGIIAVGFDIDVKFDPVDLETIKLMSIALSIVLEALPDELKNEFNL